MTPESGNANLGVGFVATCVARLAMAGAATLAAWGAVETAHGLTSQPETYGNSPYTSTSQPEYIADQQKAAEHTGDGVNNVILGATLLLAARAGDIVILDRRRRTTLPVAAEVQDPKE
jgi:hypothetical protein